MKKYITAYMNEITDFIDNKMESSDISKIREELHEFEVKIAYFQHERLIHLIVTVLFALLEMLSIYMTFVTFSLASVILSFMFLVLLIPYVMHYYFLENSVQKMYVLRDKIISKLKFLSDNE